MKVDGRFFGPNMAKLIVHKMSIDAVPPGGGVTSAIKFLSTRGRFEASAKSSSDWALRAVEAVRAAPDFTGDSSEEAIAGMILEKLEQRIDERLKRVKK